jgi:hypothetical protein
MDKLSENLLIGAAGSIIATFIVAAFLFIVKSVFSDIIIKRYTNKIEIYCGYVNNINLLYLATLIDLIIMNVCFYFDTMLWNLGDFYIINEVDISGAPGKIFTNYAAIIIAVIRAITVLISMIGLYIAYSSINRIRIVNYIIRNKKDFSSYF